MSAFDDYLQLLNNNPKMDATKQWANKLGNNVKTGIEDELPKGTGPTAMLDFASANNPISHVANMIGSMRLPSDAIRAHDWLNNGALEDVTQKQDNILNTVQSYFKKKWGGDNDQLVKYIDEGGRLNGRVGPSLQNPTNGPSLGKNYSDATVGRMLDTAANGKRIKDDEGASYIYDAIGDNFADTPTQKIMDYINERNGQNHFYDEYEQHIGSVQNVADTARDYRGTNQIAKTDAGRYFENLNDLHYLRGLKKSQLPGKSMEGIAPTWDARKIAEKASGNANRTSLIDLLKQSNEYDDYMVTDVAKNKLRIHQDAQLARATPVHNIGDEFTWYQVPDSKAAKVEGQLRDNCLKEDWMQNMIDQGESVIYSLRDKNGRPKVTAELGDTGGGSPGWVQFKGMSNSEPKAKYQPYIDSLTKDYEPYPGYNEGR